MRRAKTVIYAATTALASCGAPARAPRSLAATAQPSAQTLFTLYSPTCGKSPSLAASLAADRDLLALSANALGVSTTTLSPAAWTEAAMLPTQGFFTAVLAGHGPEGLSTAGICVDLPGGKTQNLGIDVLSGALAKTLSGAILIVNACGSARVDPRRSRVPLSVISASPFVVDTDALFGRVVPEALRQAARDPNCDGMVTDQELFEQISLLLAQRPTASLQPAFPKLRRNASSEIPLPISPVHDAACQQRQREIETFVHTEAGRLGPLGLALEAQTTLALQGSRGKPAALPSSANDYYVLGSMPDELRREVKLRLEKGGLVALPEPAVAHARRLAEYMTFAQVYEVTERCEWLFLQRLKDGALLSSTPSAELALQVPRRQSYDFSALNLDAVLWRSGVVDDAALVATPCFSEVGQCFLPPPATDAPTASKENP